MSNQLRQALIVAFRELQETLRCEGHGGLAVDRAFQHVIQLLHVEGQRKVKVVKAKAKRKERAK